ncbi:MAG: 23S rRNA (guanosine(2251)-2'-O)-methyltransferase RlmB [Bacteroidota bacterium]
MSKQNQQLIYGRHPVLEALQSDQSIDKVYLQKGTRGEFERELRLACKAREIPMTIIPKEKLRRLVRGNHQGVAAQLAAAAYQRITDVLPFLFEQGKNPLLLLLDGITDVRNLGAIARSAEICGAHAIIIGQKNSAGLTADAVKSSAGALGRIPVCREKSLINTIEYLQESGVRVAASDLQAELDISELDSSAPICLILGSEGDGISQGVARSSDLRFRLAQVGTLNSYNVSVAAGIMLYHCMLARMAHQ